MVYTDEKKVNCVKAEILRNFTSEKPHLDNIATDFFQKSIDNINIDFITEKINIAKKYILSKLNF